jgi:2-oxoglutarate dehydrogenase E1 component
MVGNTHFQRYVPESAEDLVAPEQVKRHILCTGMIVVA